MEETVDLHTSEKKNFSLQTNLWLISRTKLTFRQFCLERLLLVPQTVIELPYDPAIPLLGIYPKELKAGTQTDTCMPVFISSIIQPNIKVEAAQMSYQQMNG